MHGFKKIIFLAFISTVKKVRQKIALCDLQTALHYKFQVFIELISILGDMMKKVKREKDHRE